MAGKTIQAAGGIVVRKGARPLIAVVQRSKDDRWVLPRGKLKATERPKVGARREVVEETGHRVEVREFLGAITYRAQGRPKLVQFWHMRAAKNPSHDLMKDIAAVEWLPLKAAIRRLSYPLEKLFLDSVGYRVITIRKRPGRAKKRTKKSATAKSRAAKAPTPKPKRKSRPVSKRRRPASKNKVMAGASHVAAASKPHHSAPAHRRRSMLQRVLGSLAR